MKAIYFDMDGTVYDLYGIRDWLYMLDTENVDAYKCGQPICDMEELNALLERFIALGFIIGVVTWSAMNGSAEFNRATRKAKLEWVKMNMPAVTEFHCVKYGTPKHQVAKVKNAVQVDDNADVREAWKGITIDARENIIPQLQNLLAQVA
jgi:hypothetical protein